MALKLFLVFLTLVNIVHVKSEDDIMSALGSITSFTPYILEALSRNATSQCEEHIREIIDGLKSYSNWAMKMVDASAKIPEGLFKGNTKFLGFYDECITTEHPRKIFTGQHCVVRFGAKGESLAEFLIEQQMFKISKFYDAFKDFLDLLIGICLPSTCSVTNIQEMLTNITETIMPNATIVHVTESSCNTIEPVPIPLEIWIIVGALLGFVFITMMSTAYEYYNEKKGVKPNILLASFSLITNIRLFLSEANNTDEIKTLHGLRAITMGWIIFSHTILFSVIGPSMNIVDVIDMIKDIKNVPVINSFLAVDTFFFMSGFLVYLTFRRCIAQRGYYDVPMAFIHRYLRLTPPFAIVLLVQSVLFRYLGSGPIWKLVVDEIDKDCQKIWWQSLLYLQNYMTPLSPCAGQAWYISADMQMYWASPVILYSLFYWPGFGAVLIAFLILAISLTSFMTILTHEFGPTILITTSLTEHFEYEYTRMNTRATPWLIGAALSYIIFALDDKKIKVKLSKFWVIVGWVTGVGLSVGSMYAITAFTDFKYTTLEAAYYVPLHRIGWTLGIAWIVFACYYGYGGVVNTILSAKIFVPIGRLSYSVYLVHLSLMLYRLASSKVAYYDDERQFIYFYIGDLILSFGLAIILKLVIEMPFGIIDKCLFGPIVLLPIPRKRNIHVVNDVKKEMNGSADVEHEGVNHGFENNSERL